MSQNPDELKRKHIARMPRMRDIGARAQFLLTRRGAAA